jgi:hypothetical protein
MCDNKEREFIKQAKNAKNKIKWPCTLFDLKLQLPIVLVQLRLSLIN